jgi:general secretion pathway protein J
MKQRGFTLAEAIIAVAILGMIGVLVMGTFSTAMDTRDRAEKITSRYHQVRQAMLRMSREIQMAFLSEHRDCDDPRTKTMFVGKTASSGMRLDFTSFGHFKIAADANESDQNELSYFIDRDPDDPQKQSLFRREQNRIDEEPEEGGVEQVLAEDVTQLDFEFYDPKEDTWEDEWDTSDSDYRGRLPMFVKIKLKAKGPIGEEEEFVTKTRVFLKKPIQIVGTGFAKCVD